MSKKQKAVFLDRDGTLSVEIGYIDNINDFELYPYSAKSVLILKELGYKLIVVTNQSGVARGFFPESRVGDLNRALEEKLADEGAGVDGIYYCPHHPEGKIKQYAFNCDCRKPETGMIKAASTDYNLDLENSIIIGDGKSDIECGKRAGIRTILVRTGHGSGNEEYFMKADPEDRPDYIADNLFDAVNWIKKY